MSQEEMNKNAVFMVLLLISGVVSCPRPWVINVKQNGDGFLIIDPVLKGDGNRGR